MHLAVVHAGRHVDGQHALLAPTPGAACIAGRGRRHRAPAAASRAGDDPHGDAEEALHLLLDLAVPAAGDAPPRLGAGLGAAAGARSQKSSRSNSSVLSTPVATCSSVSSTSVSRS